MENKNDLILRIEQNNVEAGTAKILQDSFIEFFAQAQEWKEKADKLVVTDETQIAEMKDARTARLALKDIRVNANKTRKRLKEDSIKYGRAVEDAYNVIEGLISPIEKHLEAQEKFGEIKEAERKASLQIERLELLRVYYFEDNSGFDFGGMDEQTFSIFLSGCKNAYENKIEAQKKAEEEAIAKNREEEAKREALRIENARLKADAAEQERLAQEERKARDLELAAERARVEYEKKVADTEAKKIFDEQQAILKKEREEKWKLQEEIRVKKEAEEAEARRNAEAEEEILKMGDKQKFELLIKQLEEIKVYHSFKSSKYRAAYKQINELLDKTINFAVSKI